MPEPPPLTGLRAIELAGGCAGPGAGMYLADYGVDVVKVELPGGDPERGFPPLVNGLGRSFLVFNRGKRSVVVDWRRPERRRVVDHLLEHADILIADEPLGAAAGWPFPYKRLRDLNPGLIYAAVTPYGARGPWAGLPGYDPLVQAASGVMASSRTREGLPVPTGYRLADGATPMLLAHGIMMALLARQHTGLGQRVDVSMLQTAIAMQSVQLVWAENDATPPGDPFQPTVASYRCSGGRYVNVTAIKQQQWEALCRVLDLEHLIADPNYSDRAQRRSELFPLFEGIFGTRPSGEWLGLLEEAGVPCGPMLSRAELFSDPQIVENALAARVAHPAGGSVYVLGSPIFFSETPPRVGYRIPALGGHTHEVLQEAGCSTEELKQLDGRGVIVQATGPRPLSPSYKRDRGRAPSPGLSHEGRGTLAPLEGIRVLDLAGMYAGPGTAAYLGDMGADVIKIEPPTLDDSRRLLTTPFLGPNSRAFMAVNRNKRGIVLDLRQTKGREVLYRLARDADVLVHNLRPGVPERLGVDYATLSALNPRLIYAWVTAFGSRGPHRLKPAYDNVIQGYSGVYYARARRDGEPTGAGTFVSDTSLPMLLSFAIGAALWARERTGRGQLLEASLLGLALATQAPEWAAAEEEGGSGRRSLTAVAGNGTPSTGSGNDTLDPLERACPVIACADGEFIALALVKDQEWHGLCRALGRADWLGDERFASWEARASQRAELDSLLAPVFAERSQVEWTELLMTSGVPCVPVVARNDLTRQRQVCENDLLAPVQHPAAGLTRMFSIPVQLSGSPGSIRRPAPTSGQDTDAILAKVGYAPHEIQELREQGVVA